MDPQNGWFTENPMNLYMLGTGWCFGNMSFFIIYGIILPIDFHIFQDG